MNYVLMVGILVLGIFSCGRERKDPNFEVGKDSDPITDSSPEVTQIPTPSPAPSPTESPSPKPTVSPSPKPTPSSTPRPTPKPKPKHKRPHWRWDRD